MTDETREEIRIKLSNMYNDLTAAQNDHMPLDALYDWTEGWQTTVWSVAQALGLELDIKDDDELEAEYA